MVSKKVTVTSETGLHARPAVTLVNLIKNYQSNIKIIHGAITANGKSMINLLTLNATKGAQLTVECEGTDEVEALDTTCQFLSQFTD